MKTSPATKTSHSLVVPQHAMAMESSMSIRSFEDTPGLFNQVREVTVNIVAEPKSSTVMESAIPKLSHIVMIKAMPFVSMSSVKVVKIECCSLTGRRGSHPLSAVQHHDVQSPRDQCAHALSPAMGAL